MQHPYVEKPRKVLAEQYFAATQPPPAGVCTCTANACFQMPHAHTSATGWTALHDSDWIITNRFSSLTDAILTDAEFQEVFGPGGPP